MKNIFVNIREAFSESKIDKENLTISDVVLLGPVSKNGRKYTESCMRKAVSLYENIQAYVNHPDNSEEESGVRNIRNLAGKYRNIRYLEGKIKGDFVGLSNENGKLFVDIAESMPEIAGLSHNADGVWKNENGEQIVEELTVVHSVDLVSTPATTNGIFEDRSKKTMDYKDITLTGLNSNRPDLIEEIKREDQKKINELIEKTNKLETEKDEIEIKLKGKERAELISKKLNESEMPKDAITDTFKEMLINADEDKIDKLIEDRKSLYESANSGIKNMGGDKSHFVSDKSGNNKINSIEESHKILTGIA